LMLNYADAISTKQEKSDQSLIFHSSALDPRLSFHILHVLSFEPSRLTIEKFNTCNDCVTFIIESTRENFIFMALK
jgi:hypothetical protein